MKQQNELSISAVIVAYNNPEEFAECLTALVNQSYLIKRIVCIDNSSLEYQKENKDLIEAFMGGKTLIKYFINDTGERGSAKGYEIGMKMAFSESPDFIWLNDQDGVPQDNCLEKMLDAYYSCNNQDVKIIVPCLRSIEDRHYMKAFSCNFNSFLHTKGLFEECDEGVNRYIEKFGSTGTLVHKDVVAACGFYNGNIFFVGLEDVDYSLRVRKAGFKTLFVSDANYFHPDLNQKYNLPIKKKNRLIENIAPLNMSAVSTNDILNNNIRAITYCRASGYINESYCKLLPKLYNLFWAFARLLLLKMINKDIKVLYTMKLYGEGKKLAQNGDK